MIELRRRGLSLHEISARLAREGTPLSRTGVREILSEEGADQPAGLGPQSRLPGTGAIDFTSWPQQQNTALAGLLLIIPDLIALDLPVLADRAGYPDTRRIPAAAWLRSLLALKLAGRHGPYRIDQMEADPAAALLTGLTTLPRTQALTDYSYWLPRSTQRAFLSALDGRMLQTGMVTSERAVFQVDFQAVPHRGSDPEADDPHPRRGGAVTFFVRDAATRNLVYAEAGRGRDVIGAFCDHWRTASGADPHLLVMAQQAAPQQVLAELDGRGITFLSRWTSSAGLAAYIRGLSPADYRTIVVDRSAAEQRVHERPAVTLSAYPGTVRQFILSGADGDNTVLVTNDGASTAEWLLEHHLRHTEGVRSLAEMVRVFGADSMSSAVNLNIDLDVVTCVLAQILVTALRARLPGSDLTPAIFQRRYLGLPAQLTASAETITVRLDRGAWSPVLRNASLPGETTVSWWGGRTLHFELA